MEKNIRQQIIFVILWVCSSTLMAQDRYMVFFTDKSNSEYSIEQPLEFLSQRALERREKNGIGLTELDIPVNAAYVSGIEAEGADVFFTTKWMNGALAQIQPSDTATVSALNYVSHVEFIAKGVKLTNEQTPYTVPETFLDPTSVSGSTDIQLAMIGADHMHADGYTGDGALIAIFDDGFLGVNEYKPFEHVFTENRLIATRDFVRNSENVFQSGSHGSSVFSCIAANYGDMVSGTAPDASFVLCVTEEGGSEYRVEEYNWLLAAEYADSIGADVINASLGYTTFDHVGMSYTYEDMDGETTVVARAAQMLADRGVVVVVSAGNRFSWDYVSSPADAKDVLAVGSVNSSGNRSSFSSVGPTADNRIKPDIVAMGENTTIFKYALNNGEIATGGGTSFASPQIAGLAAGLLQANPSWTDKEVTNAIKYSASKALNPDTVTGFGLPNYVDAVQGVVLSASDILDDRVTVYPNPFSENTIFIDFGGIRIRHHLEVTLLDTRGMEVYSDSISPREVPEELEIGFSSAEKGIYFLILRSKKFEKMVKLIKI